MASSSSSSSSSSGSTPGVAVSKIRTPAHIEVWKASKAYSTLGGFIGAINEAVKGKSITDPYSKSPNIEKLVALLGTLDSWIDEIPPEATAANRFGNVAFRKWHARLCENSKALIAELVSDTEGAGAYVDELNSYFVVSFGNETRIDYGSGHELSFVAFLCCLSLLKVFVEDDLVAICFAAFNKYLSVVRHIQRVYTLEPAGSHGVWGLDDHQFLPYYWGSSQLSTQTNVLPSSIPDKKTAEQYAESNLFYGCLNFIHTMKRGPFFEHSRYLFDMSSVPDYAKVNKGLLKMYQAEVLLKFPVIQHFLFGSLLALDIPEGTDATAATAATVRPRPAGGATWGGPVPQRPAGARGPIGDPALDMMYPMSPAVVSSSASKEMQIGPGGGAFRVAESGSLLRKPPAQPKPE